MAASLDTGVLYRGDNLELLPTIPDESIDLVYLDPPFFTNRHYEVIWQEESEVRSFEDRWDAGIEGYIDWMRPRLLELHRVLKPTGTLYLHCDPHASHYLKAALDRIFGLSNFLSEVVWKRGSAHSSARRWGPVHDLILVYAKKAGKQTWNRPYQALDAAHKQRHYRFEDQKGRYTHGELTAPGKRNGRSGLPWRGFDVTAIGRHWTTTVDKLDLLDAEGLIYWPPDGSWPRRIRYESESRGRAIGDVWEDIPPLNMKARERLGYPTQKPEALLRRIIEASSNEGDVVLDPFCGCGTTIAVAQQLGRRWVGMDISHKAVEIMRDRVAAVPGGFSPVVLGLPETVEDLKALGHFEFQRWIIERMDGTPSPRKSGDLGIDGYTFMTYDPIQVKQQDRVGRQTVDNFQTAIRRAGKDAGVLVAFGFTRPAREEVLRARTEGLDIELKLAKDLLHPEPGRGRRRDPFTRSGQLLELRKQPPQVSVAAAELVTSARELRKRQGSAS